MKKIFLALGIFFEAILLSFYAVKQLTIKWGVDNLFLDDRRTFTLVFILLTTALIVQILAGIIVYKKNINFKQIFIFSIIFNLSLLFVWNIASNDLYLHIQRGRMVALYNANPYSVTYDSLKFQDPLYETLRTVWSGQLSLYGPTFTLFGAAISLIARNNFMAYIISYKIIYSVLNILVGYLIYKITKNAYAAFLYSWNPAILFEIQLNNHLEILMIFFMVFSIYLLLSKVDWKRYILAISILTLGSLTKFFSFLIYPFYIIYGFRKLKTIKEKLLFLLIGGFLQILIITLSFLPFADRTGFMDSLFALANGPLISPSLTMLVLVNIFEIIKVNKEMATVLSQFIFKLIYAFLIIKSAFIKRFTEKKVFILIITLSFAAFIFIYLNLLLPWYVLSLITLLAIYYGISKEKKYIVFTYLVTIYSFLLYIRTI
ncbi:hypothetical protein KW795_00395 [Candidatus Microgenomates bacterium]|nr:hypothetical protein [Candidatus Microgenomates bacterium]